MIAIIVILIYAAAVAMLLKGLGFCADEEGGDDV